MTIKVGKLPRLPGPGHQTTVVQAVKNNRPKLQIDETMSGTSLLFSYKGTCYIVSTVNDKPTAKILQEIDDWKKFVDSGGSKS
jgi:hypothetical protein